MLEVVSSLTCARRCARSARSPHSDARDAVSSAVSHELERTRARAVVLSLETCAEASPPSAPQGGIVHSSKACGGRDSERKKGGRRVTKQRRRIYNNELIRQQLICQQC